MADFLSRLVERTFGLTQVAEPVITPTFAAGPISIREYRDSSVFDIEHGSGMSPGMKAKSKSPDTRAENIFFEAGPPVTPEHEHVSPSSETISEKAEFSRDMPDVPHHLPYEDDVTRKDEKSVFQTQAIPVMHGRQIGNVPGIADDPHAEHESALKGETTVNRPRPEPMTYESPVEDETRLDDVPHAEHKAALKGETTVNRPRRESMTYGTPSKDEPRFVEVLHPEHDAALKGETPVHRPQPEPIAYEMPAEDEPLLAENTNAEIMKDMNASKDMRGANRVHSMRMFPGAPMEEKDGDASEIHIVHAARDNVKRSVYQPHVNRTVHESPANSIETDDIQKPGDKNQMIDTGNLSTFSHSGSRPASETVKIPDSAEKEPVQSGTAYHDILKPGTHMQIPAQVKSKTGVLTRKEAFTDTKSLKSKSIDDSYPENSINVMNAYLAGNPNISNLKSSKMQDSPTTITDVKKHVTMRELNPKTNGLDKKNLPKAEKHITASESPSINPTIKVTIGHVEVRAATLPAPQSAPSRQNPALSLDDYLKKRNGG